MKPIEEMTGTEKAAALLIALGPAVAAQILQHLDEESINKISLEISRIEKISVGDREELIGEFLLGLRKHRKVVQGGENVARELLNAASKREYFLANWYEIPMLVALAVVLLFSIGYTLWVTLVFPAWVLAVSVIFLVTEKRS